MTLSGISAHPLSAPLLGPPATSGAHPPGRDGQSGFVRALNGLLAGANAEDAKAEQAVRDLAAGRTDNLHGVALAVARADLSFRMVLELRNRLSDAYQEVMRMTV